MAEDNPETASLVSDPDTLTIWFADDRRIVMYPCQNNEWLNFVCIYPDTDPRTVANNGKMEPCFTCFRDAHMLNTHFPPDWGRSATRGEVAKVFYDFDHQLLTLFRQANKASMKAWQLLDMEALPTWTKSKFALMGDAAHPCLPCKLPCPSQQTRLLAPPTVDTNTALDQAQGGAQAIEDAAALAAVLPLGTEPQDVPERLELYETIRSERASRIQEYSRLTGRDWVAGTAAYDSKSAPLIRRTRSSSKLIATLACGGGG